MNVFEIVTEKIVGLLEQGIIPWRKPWTGGDAAIARNFSTGKSYRGINVFLLALARNAASHETSAWLTFNQARELGGMVRKGEKSTLVIFWKRLKVKKENAETGETEERSIPLLRYFNVFNVAQIEWKEASEKTLAKLEALKAERREIEPIDAAAALVEAMPKRPAIEHGKDGAYYRPSTDAVGMPDADRFRSAAAYYSTLFHELAHSTGHASRVGRKGIEEFSGFGSESYSQEELVAEMTAAFLRAETGIASEEEDLNSVAYCQSWLKVLKGDKRLVVMAAAQAQKAADFILDRKAAVIEEPVAEEVAA